MAQAQVCGAVNVFDSVINLNGKRQYSDTANIGLEDNLHRKAYKEDYCRVQERMEDEHEEEQYFTEGVEPDGAMQRGLNCLINNNRF